MGASDDEAHVRGETTEQEPAAAAPGNMYYGFGVRAQRAAGTENNLWGPLLEGVVSSQRYLSLWHMIVSVPKSGR